MNKGLLKKIIASGRKAQKRFSIMPKDAKAKLEKTWDIEHAYYSSALEGSKLSRKTFDNLARKID